MVFRSGPAGHADAPGERGVVGQEARRPPAGADREGADVGAAARPGPRQDVELTGFFAYPAGFTGGVLVGSVGLSGNGRADVLTGETQPENARQDKAMRRVLAM